MTCVRLLSFSKMSYLFTHIHGGTHAHKKKKKMYCASFAVIVVTNIRQQEFINHKLLYICIHEYKYSH